MLEEDVLNLAQGGGENPSAKQEPAKEEVKVEVKPYLVFGQDFSLSNPNIIDYYKTRMKMMAIKFRLVGRVNENGQYKVEDKIRYDLIKMEKEIEDSGENFYKAIALYMKKHFYFHIKIEEIEEGKAKASLYLSEYIEDFLGTDYIVTHIADFVDVFDDEFRIKVRKAFNLVDVATKIDDFAVPELAVLMQDFFDLEAVVGGLYDMTSQIFVMRMLKALEESGEKGAIILARYRQLLAESKDIEINEKYRYSHYKALLDRAVDENGGYENIGLEPKVLQSIMKDINGTVKAIESVSAKRIMELDGPIKRYQLDNKNSSGKSGGKGGNKKGSSDKKDKNKEKTKKKSQKDKKGNEKTNKGDGVTVDKEENVVIVEAEGIPSREPTPPQNERRSVPPSRNRNNRRHRKATDVEEEMADEDFGEIDDFEESKGGKESSPEVDENERAGEKVVLEYTKKTIEVEKVLEDGKVEKTTYESVEVDIHKKVPSKDLEEEFENE